MSAIPKQAHISRITEQALQIGGQKIVEMVTIVRGYEQLSAMYPERADYEVSLANAFRDLVELTDSTETSAVSTSHSMAVSKSIVKTFLVSQPR